MGEGRGWREYLKISAKGALMGAADAVPGVSGGTIAFITGIYEELIHSLRQFGPHALLTLKNEGLAATWRFVNGNFLLALFCGVLVSLLSIAQVILYVLDTYPILLWSFFFGLILAAIWALLRHIQEFTAAIWAAFIIGAAIAYGITVITPAEFEIHTWYYFIAGMIAISAMILPGISGSFILVLMGMYAPVLTAVKTVDLTIIALFGTGCVIGLLSFSHVLSWMFKHYKALTLALLGGFMLGSLNKVWPWKQTLTTRLNSDGEQVPVLQDNVLPATYEALTGEPSQVTFALLLMLVGVALVVMMEKLGAKTVG